MYVTCDELEELQARLNQTIEDVPLYVFGEDRDTWSAQGKFWLNEVEKMIPGVEFIGKEELILIFTKCYCTSFNTLYRKKYAKH